MHLLRALCVLFSQNQARVANQSAVLTEKKKEMKSQEEPSEKRGVSKTQWYEDKKKRMSKVLDANGLDMQRAYMLDTQDAAEEKYKKREKKEAAFGWDGELAFPFSKRKVCFMWTASLIH